MDRMHAQVTNRTDPAGKSGRVATEFYSTAMQERADMEKHIQDGIERAEISCQMNPSLPGCPY